MLAPSLKRPLFGALVVAPGFAAWAAWSNAGAGAEAMRRAALTQGLLSAVFSFAMYALLERVSRWLGGSRASLAAAAVLTPALVLGTMAGCHALAGTAHVVRTLLPSMILAPIGCAVYAGGLAMAPRRGAVRATRAGG